LNEKIPYPVDQGYRPVDAPIAARREGANVYQVFGVGINSVYLF
jgi:hypothetical protein